ncbi:MAG: SPOR domain-containing protein [Nevskiales bacterium]
MKRQIIGGVVLLGLLVVVIKWLGSGGEMEPDAAAEMLDQADRETRVYDLSQLDADGQPLSRPAPADATAAATDTEDAAEGLPPTAEPIATAPAPSEPVLAPSPDRPVTPAAAPTPATKPAAKPAASAGGDWIVQVGSYSSEVNARALMTRLQAAGYPSELKEVSVAGQRMYRLRAGPYAEEVAARTAAAELEVLLKQKVSVFRH